MPFSYSTPIAVSDSSEARTELINWLTNTGWSAHTIDPFAPFTTNPVLFVSDTSDSVNPNVAGPQKVAILLDFQGTDLVYAVLRFTATTPTTSTDLDVLGQAVSLTASGVFSQAGEIDIITDGQTSKANSGSWFALRALDTGASGAGSLGFFGVFEPVQKPHRSVALPVGTVQQGELDVVFSPGTLPWWWRPENWDTRQTKPILTVAAQSLSAELETLEVFSSDGDTLTLVTAPAEAFDAVSTIVGDYVHNVCAFMHPFPAFPQASVAVVANGDGTVRNDIDVSLFPVIPAISEGAPNTYTQAWELARLGLKLGASVPLGYLPPELAIASNTGAGTLAEDDTVKILDSTHARFIYYNVSHLGLVGGDFRSIMRVV